jgi:hypothetical protein
LLAFVLFKFADPLFQLVDAIQQNLHRRLRRGSRLRGLCQQGARSR